MSSKWEEDELAKEVFGKVNPKGGPVKQGILRGLFVVSLLVAMGCFAAAIVIAGMANGGSRPTELTDILLACTACGAVGALVAYVLLR